MREGENKNGQSEMCKMNLPSLRGNHKKFPNVELVSQEVIGGGQ